VYALLDEIEKGAVTLNADFFSKITDENTRWNILQRLSETMRFKDFTFNKPEGIVEFLSAFLNNLKEDEDDYSSRDTQVKVETAVNLLVNFSNHGQIDITPYTQLLYEIYSKAPDDIKLLIRMNVIKVRGAVGDAIWRKFRG